ncbi:MAG TPA: tRNA glutamyl-Q(34) synthetase GluQRS [Gallionellaceae bacterium]|nr:tRNA glutamyl-Q(34) synthetase GluQRS [Gallionellaceae bacterium]
MMHSTAAGEPRDQSYCGRFAPSPTGPLHFGSLVAAAASFLDARHRGGTWLVRMEDLDGPRCVPGAAAGILRTLESFGLHWDGEIMYQSRRTAAYAEALHSLQAQGLVYPCACTRREIADSALHGADGLIYPGTCRNGIPVGHRLPADVTGASRTYAWRVRADRAASWDGEAGVVAFDDELQGRFLQHLEREIGDFVVKRADGLYAYQLAVVVDDAFQGVTHVVRGADLLASTPRQIYLQRLLGLPALHYAHLPVAVDERGEKLSKQTLAVPVDGAKPRETLWLALSFLRQSPPHELRTAPPQHTLQWAAVNWHPERLRGWRALPAPTQLPA